MHIATAGDSSAWIGMKVTDSDPRWLEDVPVIYTNWANFLTGMGEKCTYVKGKNEDANQPWEISDCSEERAYICTSSMF